jgi:branched-subunit amino acid aminotransferase/4-amino-4-deoxychorismate lyase
LFPHPHDILLDITHHTLIKLTGDDGCDVEAADMELYDAYTTDEQLIGNAAGGILPVVNPNSRRTGTATPGPVLHHAYWNLSESGRHGTAVCGAPAV